MQMEYRDYREKNPKNCYTFTHRYMVYGIWLSKIVLMAHGSPYLYVSGSLPKYVNVLKLDHFLGVEWSCKDSPAKGCITAE